MLLLDLLYELFLTAFGHFSRWLTDLVLGLLPE